ncbi:DUF305 domain-containing protein [Streptomyces chartreusis]|uniref:DUF305 domain-containing protein n=1 Tax=Streptomyces chartreusis TaxID=1969 RepID=A0A7H8T945_STRCX|nr:DUF305 domain-containing protein [Streptomyces chartreusis]QKZ20013.1 DUF305 domain-containing protein [Streptomyces chartreusis]
MNSTRTFVRRTALAATAVTAALVLAACGGDGGDSDAAAEASSSSSASAGAHNAQDVTFAQGMIPHHQQALQMAQMAADRASSTQVKDLAERIRKAQDPEIETMSGWLKTWGEDVPSAAPGVGHSGHSGGSGMAGMMDAKDMDELMKASGKAFDTLFLTLMVEHHEGAVEMAESEKSEGRYAPATELADAVVTAQTAEIQEMNKLLGKTAG